MGTWRHTRTTAALTGHGRTLCLCVLAGLAASGASAPGASATSAVWGWGENGLGQLCNGTTHSTKLPTMVNGLTEVKAVAAGDSFSLVLLADGTVYACGADGSGQLGDGKTDYSDEPVLVEKLSEVVQIAAGGSHALALTKKGEVYAWGANEWGQIGNGTTEKSDRPELVGKLGGITAIAAGSSFSLALNEEGEVFAWGANGFGQLGVDEATGPETCRVSEEAEGHVVFLEEQGCSKTPGSAVGLTERASGIAAGDQHALALLKGGTAEAWGENDWGQLGDGTKSGPEKCTIIIEKEGKPADTEKPCSRSPVAVQGLSEATAVAAGRDHSLAIVSGGKVQAWGAGGSGQLGDGKEQGSDVPVDVAKIEHAIAIAGGGFHSLALVSSGTVDAWGANESGQLGDGTTQKSDEPVPVEYQEEATCIAAGTFFSLACGPYGPEVDELDPSHGSIDGGTHVIIRGEFLTNVVEVRFGSNPATKIKEISSSEIEVTTPKGDKLGAVCVVVVTKHGATSCGGGAPKFTYESSDTEVPEFGRCAKVATGTGKYSGATCMENSAGNYEWHPGAGELKKFSDSGSSVTLENTSGTKMTCTKASASGEYTGIRLVTEVTLTLTGCALSGAKCTSQGAKEGEIVSGLLEGTLGWQERETDKVALDLAPADEAEYLIEATCGATALKVGGSVIGAITTVNKMETSFKVKFKQADGEQDIEHFEEKEPVNDVLEMTYGISEKRAGLTVDLTQSNEEDIEINTLF